MLETLIALVVIGVVVIAVPLLLVGLFVRMALELLLLPFRLIGMVFHLAAMGVGLLFKVLFGLGSLVGVLLMLAFLPLLPFLVLGLMIWGLVKVLEPRTVVVPYTR